MVKLPTQEPLRLECEHFLECVATRRTPRTSAESGVRVLQVLEACEQSLLAKGQPMTLGRSASKYQAHPTAVIDEGCEIGEGTRIWHFSHVMSGSRIGKHCNLGQNVVISPSVIVGDNVKIQNNVSVYTGVEARRRRLLRTFGGFHKRNQSTQSRAPKTRVPTHTRQARGLDWRKCDGGCWRHFGEVQLHRSGCRRHT